MCMYMHINLETSLSKDVRTDNNSVMAIANQIQLLCYTRINGWKISNTCKWLGHELMDQFL